MDSATVFLIFSGLIAFVPGKGGESGAITAFLIKKGHDSLISVPSEIVECPDTCTDEEGFCRCKLSGAVVLDPFPERATRTLRERPVAILPNSSSVNDDGWLIHMKNTDRYFAEVDPSRVGNVTAANLVFGWDEATTCALDDDDEEGFVYAITFIRQGVITHEQAVAELVVFRATIQSEVLTVRVSDGVYLKVKCGGGGCPITITNEPFVPMGCSNCGDCATGGHFGDYAQLTGGGLGSVRLFRQCGKYSQPEMSKVDICEHAKRSIPLPAVSNRIICPMVVLEP